MEAQSTTTSGPQVCGDIVCRVDSRHKFFPLSFTLVRATGSCRAEASTGVLRTARIRREGLNQKQTGPTHVPWSPSLPAPASFRLNLMNTLVSPTLQRFNTSHTEPLDKPQLPSSDLPSPNSWESEKRKLVGSYCWFRA